MAACRSRKGRQKCNHTKEDLLFQFDNKKNVREDLIDIMEQSKSKLITFKYGKKKWIASEDGLISQTYNDGQYSMHGFNLKPGDIILWGENNWYCTFGIEDIVCMEKYLKNVIEEPISFHYERIKSVISMHQSNDQDSEKIMETHESGSQFCMTPNDLKEPEKDNPMEYDEDIVAYIPGSVKYFICRELKDIQRIEWAYLNKPLKEGDVIWGPRGDAGSFEGSMWIVSKCMILRKTYNNTVNRQDIKLQVGHIFDVGDNLHYASRYMSLFICVSEFASQDQIINDIKKRNKQRQTEQWTKSDKQKVVEID